MRSSSPYNAILWSLGIILFYLSCGGHVPWLDASVDHPRFMYYIEKDSDYLLHNFPISRQLNDLLNKSLCLNRATGLA